MKIIKGNTSITLKKEFSSLLKAPTLWTRNYFVSTAGNVSPETIRRYVESQKTEATDRESYILEYSFEKVNYHRPNKERGFVGSI